MRKETVISVGDLRHICITCPHCQTRFILDMDAPYLGTNDRPNFAPSGCPGCRQLYDSTVGNLNALHRVYCAIHDAKIGTAITFLAEDQATGESN
jgi:phage terminase large subunit GpA-like protein